ncbi:hypothetical protein [Pseudokineococcus sp. 1T1Z-3]|uniref:hypothetical protein n=1 Tax=Pseudokineococcus sp. 1T1Z-3 TaxID=3132745 RepID=UPI0030AD01DA
MLAAAAGTSDAVVAATLTEPSTHVTAPHLRHFSRSAEGWVTAGGIASAYPTDVESCSTARHVDSPARPVDGVGFVSSVEDDSGDVCFVTLAQVRRLVGASAAVRYDDREQPVTIGPDGLVPVLVRLHRGVVSNIDLVVRDSAGRVVSTTRL